jgi:DNA-binding beta-propeller fold protein YncE
MTTTLGIQPKTWVLALAVLICSIGSYASAQTQPGNWQTPLATKLGITVEKSFDSKGADAWDPKKHPLVFVTTEGPGYGGLLSGVSDPGIAIVDADSREVVTSQHYDVLAWGWKNVFEDHGVGVSPDGKWIYLPTGEGTFGTMGFGRLLIINARTLKLDKVLHMPGNPHHIKAFTTPDGRQYVMGYGWGQALFVLDPAQDNKVVGGLDFNEIGNDTYLYFASPDGEEIIASGRFRDSHARKDTFGNVMVRISTKDWKVTGYIPIQESNPVWVAFSADNKYAYFSGAVSSRVFKYDRKSNKIIGEARSGVDGPYGVHFGWNDKDLYVIGKGEESHNRGKVIGMVDTSLMERSDRPVDQFVTNCIRGDHGTLHPDPDANELWISCNSSFEVVIFDLDTKTVTKRIPMPNGGSSHSGAFVKYDGWNGTVLSDQNGLHGTALKAKRDLLKIKLDPAPTGNRS